ncbi:hypothetical protein BZA05DRAFT_405219 [Tricharina praecox]|uniref:uncharacterized protein n=1 Tax=Tricharina praecox TaxID=43433 RepID=UPI002220B5B5|nr:uncharacterized protein BZA05DRAFT_405219 [Tricharina praecox]KAI5847566.1 hypothetical protein BZA05DRAFT_405219 [Tricharina praecox]
MKLPTLLTLPLLALLALAATPAPVPIELHLMSQCPDAVSCLRSLITPALPSLLNISTLRLTFIGTAASGGGISCPHGPSECLGDMLHLCGAALSTPPMPAPVERYWGFTTCLFDDYGRVAEEGFVKGCTERVKGAGWGFEELNACVSDLGPGGGQQLLHESVRRTQETGVKTSCTVRVAGRTVCVRDGGVWKQCEGGSRPEDLVRQVREAYERNGMGRSVREQVLREGAVEGNRWMEL